jgi:hypothetical protein
VAAQRKIRGANLGNWLVLERWMEPAHSSPFAGVDADDESGLALQLDPAELALRLERHRSSYVTRDSLAWLADVGCTLVRVPVPHHLWGDGTHPACVEHLDRAFDWARELGLGLLVDLHTVPGGQNGFDNSGTSGLCTWHLRYEQVEATLSILERIARRHAGDEAFFGLEVMNEPASRLVLRHNLDHYGQGHEDRVAQSRSIPHEVLAQFYRLCYERLHPVLGRQTALVFHDQFQLWAWEHFLPRDRYPGVWLDTHHYLSTYARIAHARSLRAHLVLARAIGALVARAERFHPVLVGEWSLANHLSPRLVGEARDDALRRLAKAQLAAYDRGEGSCFWSLRNGRHADWSLRSCVEHGWLELSGLPVK